MRVAMRLLGSLLIAIMLSACRSPQPQQSTPTPSPAAAPATPLPPTPDPTAALEPAETNEPAPPTSPTPDPTPQPEIESLPPLLHIPLADRDPFSAGLKPSQQDVLSQLPGATVYHLQLKISDTMTAVSGRAQILYTNLEEIPLDALYFHLFPNLLGGALDVTAAHINTKSVSPAYELEASIMRLPLASPLPPGQQLTVDLEFNTTVPVESGRNYGIFAYVDDVLALAHFYPMIAVYDQDGWNTEPPALDGDVVYADTSFYLVQVTATAPQVLVASGVEIQRQEDKGLQTVTFAAGPMRDFYLASSDQYVAVQQEVGQTRINSYAPAAYADAASLALETAAAALQSYGDRFGEYPFVELDIVATPTLALGVEYPGVFANTVRIYDLDDETNGARNRLFLESTTAHETGHQWFYSLVGNDQLDEPWLDESVTQYATWLYYQDRYGQSAAMGYYQSFLDRWGRVEMAEIPVGLPVAAYADNQYGAIVYGRGPIFVDKLAVEMGQETFDAFLRDYAQIFKWKTASAAAFKQLAEQRCECDLTAIFDAWVTAR